MEPLLLWVVLSLNTLFLPRCVPESLPCDLAYWKFILIDWWLIIVTILVGKVDWHSEGYTPKFHKWWNSRRCRLSGSNILLLLCYKCIGVVAMSIDSSLSSEGLICAIFCSSDHIKSDQFYRERSRERREELVPVWASCIVWLHGKDPNLSLVTLWRDLVRVFFGMRRPRIWRKVALRFLKNSKLIENLFCWDYR